MAATWDSAKPYRVDVEIQGEQIATVNYATATDEIGVIKSVAMAFENSGDDDFPISVREIRITNLSVCQHDSGTAYEYADKDGRFPAFPPNDRAGFWSSWVTKWECDECGFVYENENAEMRRLEIEVEILKAKLRGE